MGVREERVEVEWLGCIIHIYETVKEQNLSIKATQLSGRVDNENGYNEYIYGDHKLLCTIFICP